MQHTIFFLTWTGLGRPRRLFQTMKKSMKWTQWNILKDKSSQAYEANKTLAKLIIFEQLYFKGMLFHKEIVDDELT